MKKARILAKKVGLLPGFQQPVARIWNTYEHAKFIFYVYLNTHKNKQFVEINPYQIYWVNPHEIRVSEMSSFDLFRYTGCILDGEWDQKSKSIKETNKYNVFEQRYHNDVPWKETSFYKKNIKNIRNKNSKRYATIAEFENKLDSYDNIYEQFNRGDYFLQAELIENQDSDVPGDGGRAMFQRFTNHTLMRHEIAVNIGRDGVLLRNDGRHRIALAQLANLDEVPVRIVVRHTEWQSLRNEIGQIIKIIYDGEMSLKELKRQVRDEIRHSLSRVRHGLDHPDIEIIFERRIKTS